MSKLDDQEWKIECSRERLLELSRDPGFGCLMRLARLVNAMRFGQVALYHTQDDDGPMGNRALASAFYFHGGLLYEALQLIPELRKHFGSHPHWERSFGRFRSDEQIRKLYAQGTDLHRLRNHIGFHVLEMVPDRSLPTLDLPEYTLVHGRGRTLGQIYYPLADSIALHYLFGSPRTFSKLLEEFLERGSAITALLMDFLNAADILIGRAM